MANPWHHAVSSTRKWGGVPADYLPIHQWFDESKAHHADFRHRALRHHAEGIFLMESIFGVTLQLSAGRCESCGHDAARHGEYEADLPVLASRVVCSEQGCVCNRFLGKQVPTRWVGEQHVVEDLGRIPAATDWLRTIKAEPWMNRSRRLSVELEQEGATA
jgi:hypothetical protein